MATLEQRIKNALAAIGADIKNIQLLGANKDYVQSRGMNLVTNGTGLLGNNANFSAFTYNTSDIYVGRGAFRTSLKNALRTNDEYIPVIPDLYYMFRAALKSTYLEINNYAYGMIVCYDVQQQTISPVHYTRLPGTSTTLAQPLKLGDTKIFLTSVANWTTGTPSIRTIRIEAFRNAFGYLWPPGTYSRHVTVYNPYDNTGVDANENSVVLKAPWNIQNPDTADKSWPAGTPVVVSFDGGSYLYPTNIGNTPVPAAWTQMSGVIGGVRTDGQVSTNNFVPGTAFVRLGWLLNRRAITTDPYPTVGNETAVSGVYFSEVTPQTLSGGFAGWTGTYLSQDGKTVTVKNGIITSVA